MVTDGSCENWVVDQELIAGKSRPTGRHGGRGIARSACGYWEIVSGVCDYADFPVVYHGARPRIVRYHSDGSRAVVVVPEIQE